MPLVKKIEDKGKNGDQFVNAILFLILLLLASIGGLWISESLN